MIKKNDVVSISYILKNANGEELGRAETKEPLNYLHGAGNIVPGLESAITGLAVGDKKEVTIPPENAYGEVDPSLMLKIARSNFPADVDIQPNMQFSSDMGGQERVFTVDRIEGSDVCVNGNHPLAGETLNFSVEILAVREATEEELAHGHVHDGSGHHH